MRQKSLDFALFSAWICMQNLLLLIQNLVGNERKAGVFHKKHAGKFPKGSIFTEKELKRTIFSSFFDPKKYLFPVVFLLYNLINS